MRAPTPSRQGRVGLSWRGALAADVLGHADRIEVLEVLAGDFLQATRDARRALRALGARFPIVVHGTNLGLASTEPVDKRRLEAMARLIDDAQPTAWSEHLAFVRAGGSEVGHLAAPPRNDATLDGLARNVARARNVVGSAPLLENVATLVDPPGSDRDEAAFLREATHAADATLLVDLHNLHANAQNFGFSARDAIHAIPPERIALVHLAGGRRIDGGRRLLDDHLHDVPDAVFELLEVLAAHATHAPDVIIERDGRFPPFDVLLGEVERARAALERGRVKSRSRTPVASTLPGRAALSSRSGAPLERFLARLYSDDALAARFVAAPIAAAEEAGLGFDDACAIARVDPRDLALARESFRRKRDAYPRPRWWRRALAYRP